MTLSLKGSGKNAHFKDALCKLAGAVLESYKAGNAGLAQHVPTHLHASELLHLSNCKAFSPL
jgi:hypothetical protein